MGWIYAGGAGVAHGVGCSSRVAQEADLTAAQARLGVVACVVWAVQGHVVTRNGRSVQSAQAEGLTVRSRCHQRQVVGEVEPATAREQSTHKMVTGER